MNNVTSVVKKQFSDNADVSDVSTGVGSASGEEDGGDEGRGGGVGIQKVTWKRRGQMEYVESIKTNDFGYVYLAFPASSSSFYASSSFYSSTSSVSSSFTGNRKHLVLKI